MRRLFWQVGAVDVGARAVEREEDAAAGGLDIGGWDWSRGDASYQRAGALLALSTDAPTARPTRSPVSTSPPPERPRWTGRSHRFTRVRRVARRCHRLLDCDAAASVGDESWRRLLAPGYAADLVVIDPDPFDAGPESLLSGRVVETVVAGTVQVGNG